MINNIKNFVVKNYKTIIKVLFGLFILYWLIFFLTPKITMSSESKQIIDSLNTHIKNIELEQLKIDSNIVQYNKEINEIDKNIIKLNTQKTIIKEYYHEKIISVDSYNSNQLDSFFSRRYGLNP